MKLKGFQTVGTASLIGAVTDSLSKIGLGFLLNNNLVFQALSFFLERALGYLAKKGIVLLNIGLIDLKVPREKKAFDAAMSKALELIEKSGELSENEIKKIDDEVIKAFDRFAVFKRLP